MSLMPVLLMRDEGLLIMGEGDPEPCGLSVDGGLGFLRAIMFDTDGGFGMVPSLMLGSMPPLVSPRWEGHAERPPGKDVLVDSLLFMLMRMLLLKSVGPDGNMVSTYRGDAKISGSCGLLQDYCTVAVVVSPAIVFCTTAEPLRLMLSLLVVFVLLLLLLLPLLCSRRNFFSTDRHDQTRPSATQVQLDNGAC